LTLNIAEPELYGYRTIDGLADEEFNALVAALREPTRELSPADEIKTIRRVVPKQDAPSLFFAIADLFDLSTSPESYAKSVSESVLGLDPKTKTARERLEARLRTIQQQLGRIGTLRHATELLVRNERNFIGSHTVTDLRPAFGNKLSDGPEAYVLMHTLEIRWNGVNTENEAFVVTMDEADVDDLMAVLERCKQKAAVLKKQAEYLRLPYVVTNRTT